ncbi:MAG: NAD-dependent epimerase/dehydratase family protein [DPANN group archaeon]|nr:NAD-dependent epimerase/dehydratase family protein [DPANN group archaeon]
MEFKDKIVLVTGGAGAIGNNLCTALLAEDITKLIIIDDLSSGQEAFIPKDERIEFEKASVIYNEVLSRIFSKNKIDIVYHLAANFANQNSVDHPEKDLEVNGMGTLRVLKHCADYGVKRFVYTSSSCVYGDMNGQVSEKNVVYHLDTPYAITKLLGERYATYFREHYGVETVTLRLFNSFGPGELPGKYRNVIPNFVAKAINKEPLPIMGSGEETRDFNYVDNVIQALLLSVKVDKAVGGTFNIGSGKETAVRKIAEIINKITGNNARFANIPKRSWDSVNRRSADISHAQEILGYSPVNDLESQIRHTYEWILNETAE